MNPVSAASYPALLEFSELELRGSPFDQVEHFSLRGSSIACLGGAVSLVHALVDPSSVLRGKLLLQGQSPEEVLRLNRGAYAPKRIPLEPGLKTFEALRLSARLVNIDKNQVSDAMKRCGLEDCHNRPLGKLTRLQARLSGLAHGLCGNPELVILDDLFDSLSDDESETLATILATELKGRSWIAALSADCQASRALMLRADQLLATSRSQLLPAIKPDSFDPHSFWVVCLDEAHHLAVRLRQAGADVAESPRDNALLVVGCTSLHILQHARELQACIVELSPSISGEDFPNHATSPP